MTEDLGTLTQKSIVKISCVKSSDREIIIKLYRRRWLILILFMIYAALVAGQWVEYSIISNIISRYYNVPMLAVNCTGIVYLLSYPIFVFPLSYISERIGLRWMIVLGCGLCCLGTWIKVYSVSPDRFLVTLFGQFLIAICMVIFLLLPGRLAAKWFGSNELSTATSLGLLGSQFGIAFLFLIPPMIVKNHPNIDDIGNDLFRLFVGVAVIATVNFALVIIFFKDEPKLPPNESRALQKSNSHDKKMGFFKALKKLITNPTYLILCNAYGLNVGSLNAQGILLNPLFLMHFKNCEEDAGRIGLVMLTCGMIGSIMCGIILDKTHKYKETSIIVYFCSLCGQMLFAYSLLMEIKWMAYVSSIIMGCFMTSFMAVGYEIAVECTYPISEAHSAGILNITNNIYGIVLVLIQEAILVRYGDLYVQVIFSAILVVGLLLTIVNKDEQRRQDAKKTAHYHGISQRDTDENRISA